MTKVKIKRNNAGKISIIECDGHTKYGVKGEDIVCASLSTIVQTTALGLLQVAGIKAEMKIDEQRGYLKITIPEDITEIQRHDADVLTSTMLIGINDLLEEYSDYIELEVI